MVYGSLPDGFIYVDGTINKDGKQYFGKMDYVPCSNCFRYDKYEKDVVFTFLDENRPTKGDAGAYCLFEDKLCNISKSNFIKYASWTTFVAIAANLTDSQMGNCLVTYIRGKGGNEQGLVVNSTRKYINSSLRVNRNPFGINSANYYFNKNMPKAVSAAKSVLNKYNREIYISLSPYDTWTGSHYHDVHSFTNWYQNIDALLNLPAFGTYNKSDASVTLHCVYNPDTEEYSMQFVYYLIDYYDIPFDVTLNEMNMLGLAQSYELYGSCNGFSNWKRGQNPKFVLK